MESKGPAEPIAVQRHEVLCNLPLSRFHLHVILRRGGTVNYQVIVCFEDQNIPSMFNSLSYTLYHIGIGKKPV
jgi:hypothetical protein